ncbi:MAG: hypothetical protein KJO07_08005, partial [Deltaproteobacteria bacterium]|nr:hypothetical protein [Deltaproteobacteria bacterium]
FKTTTGTRLSMLSSIEAGGFTWNHECWEPTVFAAQARPVTFPEPFGVRDALSFPSGEVITVPRHIDAARVQTFISVTEDSALARIFNQGASLVSPLLGALISSPLGALAKAKLAEHSHDPSDAERERSLFAIVARAERSFERRQVGVSGADPYGVTAEIMAWGAERLVADGPLGLGVVTPSEAFDPEQGLRAIAEQCELSVVRQ